MIGHRPDDRADVVGGVAPGRHHLAQLGCRPVGRVVGGPGRGHLVGVGRQIGQDVGHGGRRIVGLEGAQPAGSGVDTHPAQVFGAEPHPGELGHHRGTGHEGHGRRSHDHHIGQAEQQCRPRDHRTGGHGQHRDHARAGGHGGGGGAPAVEGVDTLADVGPARRQLDHQRQALAERQLGGHPEAVPVLSGQRAPTAVGGRPRPDHGAALHRHHLGSDGPRHAGTDPEGRRPGGAHGLILRSPGASITRRGARRGTTDTGDRRPGASAPGGHRRPSSVETPSTPRLRRRGWGPGRIRPARPGCSASDATRAMPSGSLRSAPAPRTVRSGSRGAPAAGSDRLGLGGPLRSA